MAQWIEHRIPVPRVGGSSPFRRTNKRRSESIIHSVFYFCREEGTRKGGTSAHTGVRNMPGACFLARGRVHRRKTHPARGVGFLLLCVWWFLQTSAAGDGWTEPNLYLRKTQMQTSPLSLLACEGWVKNAAATLVCLPCFEITTLIYLLACSAGVLPLQIILFEI